MNTKLNLGTVFFIAIIFISTSLSAQWIKGNGNIIKENRNLTNFKAVYNSSSADIIITQGDQFAVVVESDEKLVPHIITKIRNNGLYIFIDKSYRSIEVLNIWITMPELEMAKVSGSGDIKFPETFKTNDLYIGISGSGDFSGELDVKKLEYNVSGSGDADFSGVNGELKVIVSGSGDIEAEDLRLTNCDIKIVGSGDVELSGSTDNLNLLQSGSGDIDAYSLKAVSATVKTSGSGDVQVYVIEKLNAVSAGSGDIYYKGNPPAININTNGSGEFIKR